MNILTFDIEDWFHILDLEETEDVASWHKYESRLERNLEFILDFLSKGGYKATFFILGWIAEKYPEVIKKIFTKIPPFALSDFLVLIYTQADITIVAMILLNRGPTSTALF